MKDDATLADFYNNIVPQKINSFDLLLNQYLLIEFNDEIVDRYKWTEEGYVHIPYQKIESAMFGKITAQDVYQEIAIDSLRSNQMTVLRGKPGSGKSICGLSYLFQELEKGTISKIIIFTNTVAVRGAAKLGFYPGTKDEKLLDSQIGNFLKSKLGDEMQVERMLDEGTLMLLPVSDCRGFDTAGLNAGVYITEAQNTSIDMMKLLLQRIGEDSIVVIDGDDKTQTDMKEYMGSQNGLRRLSQVFRGQPFYGEVTLQNIHRSRIASIADKM